VFSYKQAFSNGQLGKGVCIIPEEGKIVSPCEGVISALFPTGHAIGIKSNTGAEVLIHVGKDTYNLPEGIFKKLKAQGDKVKTGDTIIEFDLNEMKKNGMNTGTAVVVTNTKEYEASSGRMG
jgi:PTS system beta-glucosides-specific IIC component